MRIRLHSGSVCRNRLLVAFGFGNYKCSTLSFYPVCSLALAPIAIRADWSILSTESTYFSQDSAPGRDGKS